MLSTQESEVKTDWRRQTDTLKSVKTYQAETEENTHRARDTQEEKDEQGTGTETDSNTDITQRSDETLSAVSPVSDSAAPRTWQEG